MPAEEAVIDSPALDNTDVGGDTLQVQEQLADDAIAQDGGETPEQAAGDGRTLPGWLKSYPREDSKAYDAARGYFFQQQKLQDKLKDFDLDGAKNFLTEYGGIEGASARIQELTEASTRLQGIEQGIANGDASVLQDFYESDGFAAIAPQVYDQFRERFPDEWQAQQSGVFAATIQGAGVPNHLDRGEMLLDNLAFALQAGNMDLVNQVAQQLRQNYGGLKTWAGSFSQAAQNPQRQQANPQQKRGEDKLSQREQQLNQREQQQFDEQLTQAVEQTRKTEIEAQLAPYFKRSGGNKDAEQLAVSEVRRRVLEKLASDANFKKQNSAFLQKRDRQGSERLIASREKPLIGEMAKQVGAIMFRGSAAQPKQDETQQQQQVQRPSLPARPTSRSEILRAALA